MLIHHAFDCHMRLIRHCSDLTFLSNVFVASRHDYCYMQILSRLVHLLMTDEFVDSWLVNFRTTSDEERIQHETHTHTQYTRLLFVSFTNKYLQMHLVRVLIAFRHVWITTFSSVNLNSCLAHHSSYLSDALHSRHQYLTWSHSTRLRTSLSILYWIQSKNDFDRHLLLTSFIWFDDNDHLNGIIWHVDIVTFQLYYTEHWQKQQTFGLGTTNFNRFPC
jgi:hypothetical protein